MSQNTRAFERPVAAVAMEALPAVLRPGTWATPDGPLEISTAAFADAALASLPADSLLFRMGDVVGRLTGTPGARRFTALDIDTTRLQIDESMRIVQTSEDERTGAISTTYVPCGRDLAGLVLAAARSSSRVRSLRAVVNHPVYLRGYELAAPGYNASAEVFYDEPDDLRGLDATCPAPLEVLDNVLDGFCFKDPSSRENALAYMVTFVVRHAIDGNVPGFLVRAHRERTGKTYLVRTMNVAVRGEEPPLLQLGSTEEEREKRITSELLRGSTSTVFDNLPAGEEIDSPALAMLLTSRVYTGRVLGKSANPRLPNETTVALTGNNIAASGEIAQRLVPIHLQADRADPQNKADYPHLNPVAYARARRHAVLGAVLDLVERWKAAGRPPFAAVTLGGFEAWTRDVGGILATSGSTGFLGNLREWQESADEFSADAAVLLADWYRDGVPSPGASLSAPVQAKAIRERAERLELFARFRQGGTPAAVASTFGKRVLAVIVDRIISVEVRRGDEVERREVAVRRESSGSTSLYRLEVVR